MVVDLLFTLPVLVLIIFIHEMGHAIGAWLTKTKIEQFICGPFIVWVQDKRLEFSLSHGYVWGGNVTVDASSYIQGKNFLKKSIKKIIIISLMGPIASICTGIIALTVNSEHAFFFIYGVASIAMGIINLLFGLDGKKLFISSKKNLLLLFYWAEIFTHGEAFTDEKEESFRFLLQESVVFLNTTYENKPDNITSSLNDLMILSFVMYYCQYTGGKSGLNMELFIEAVKKSLSDRALPKENRSMMVDILYTEVVNLKLANQWEEATTLLFLANHIKDVAPLTKPRVQLIMQTEGDGDKGYLAQLLKLKEKQPVAYEYEIQFLKKLGLWQMQQ